MNMYQKYILDCTLRDGGYVNNWEFNNKTTGFIIKSLIDAKVDYIECGYISNTKVIESESTYFESFDQINKIIKNIYPNEKLEKTNFCIMLNRGEYDVNSFPDNTIDNIVNIIRFAFHKKDLHQAFEDTKILLKKGYKVFAQPMVTQLYTQEELIETINLFNTIDINALYIVDSFGNMTNHDFTRLMKLFDENMKDGVSLGYHSHNNLQLAFSNAIKFLEAEIKRPILLDSSIFGMGRGAGNLNTELVATHFNSQYESKYLISPLLETMDSYLHKLHKTYYWGYSIEHYISAVVNCHPSSASYLLKKKNLSIIEIQNVLNSLNYDQRNKYDKSILDEAVSKYLTTNKSNVNDTVSDIFNEINDIVLIGSGPSLNTATDDFKSLKKIKSKAKVIALNFVPENIIEIDYYFFSNQKRFKEFELIIPREKLIVTSNIDLGENNISIAVLDFHKLLNLNETKSRNVAVLFLNFLSKLKSISDVYLIGFDGYDANLNISRNNFFGSRIIDKEEMQSENSIMIQVFKSYYERFKFHFVTSSFYQKDLPISVCGIIPARYKSTRFPGKPLALINGVPMIKRTYDQVINSKYLDKLIVATESEEIYKYCKGQNIEVEMTSDKCLTGTDRVAEIAMKLNYDLYINIQGDEPVIDMKSIQEIVDAYNIHRDNYIAYNLYKRTSLKDDIGSPNTIKIITNEKDELLYMSRYAVPFSRIKEEPVYQKQVCVYGFTRKALEVFSSNSKTKNERFEDIELLRFIDLGYSVKMIETFCDSIAVDIPEDIKKVEDFLNKNINS